uniref:HIG1 domain-containing protein n=2 Tax=Aureimonas frigidaquae TaxID=424757 RepID=A0A0P0Z014_9HYPH|nr:hypothetical protein [Aureimonas frigidaquae]
MAYIPPTPTQGDGMSSFLTYLALALMIAVALVLVAGLRNMLVGGPGNRSQKLMRLRVMLQALAVLVIVLFLLFAR